MPVCEKPGCKSRPRGDDTLCKTCKSKDNDDLNSVQEVNGGESCDEMVSVQNDVPSSRDVTLMNELLMYTAYHRKSSPRDDLIKLLCSFFKEEQVKDAKDLLWATFSSHDCLGDYVERRDSVNKPKIQAMCLDIYKAMGIIDEMEVHVNYCAKDWSLVPKIAPGSITDIGIAEKMSDLEARFKLMCDRIGSLECDTRSHGTLIQEINSKTDALKSNVDSINNGSPKEDAPNQQVNAHATEKNLLAVIETLPSTSSATAGPSTDKNLPENSSDANDGPFMRPTHEVRRENKTIRQQQRRMYSKVASDTTHRAPERKHNAKVIGLATGTGLRSAPLPNRDFFVYRVHKEDGVDKIKAFLTSKKINVKEVELTSHLNAKFNSFKVTVDIKDADVITNASFWEKGICVRKWFQKVNEN